MKWRKLLIRSSSYWEDMLYFVVINMTVSLFLFEQTRFPLISWIHNIIFVMAIIYQIVIIVKNGMLRRFEFLLFTLLYYIIPQCTFWIEGYLAQLRIYSKWLDFANQVFIFLVIQPMRYIIDYMFYNHQVTMMVSLNLILLIVVVIFYIGYLVVNRSMQHK